MIFLIIMIKNKKFLYFCFLKTLNLMSKTSIEIPTGTTLEEIRARKKIIRDFYATWNAANPTKQVFNANLREGI